MSLQNMFYWYTQLWTQPLWYFSIYFDVARKLQNQGSWTIGTKFHSLKPVASESRSLQHPFTFQLFINYKIYSSSTRRSKYMVISGLHIHLPKKGEQRSIIRRIRGKMETWIQCYDHTASEIKWNGKGYNQEWSFGRIISSQVVVSFFSFVAVSNITNPQRTNWVKTSPWSAYQSQSVDAALS